MASMIRASSTPSLTLAVVAVLIASACSSEPRVASADGTAAPPSPLTPPPVTTPHRNGGLAFSRAIGSSVDGALFDVVLREVDIHGVVGSVVARDVAYRTAPSWAPDGLAFAFLGTHGITVRLEHDARLIVPCHPPACSGLGAPAWSPDGSAIAFAGELDGDQGLFQVPPDGGPPSPIATGLAVVGAPAWSPTGDQLAVITSSGPASNLQILDAASGQVQRTIDLPGMRLGASVAWSPTGDRLALEVEGSDQGEHQGIYLLALDGSNAHVLTVCLDAGCTDLSPSFSPDGRWVVFTRARCDEPGSDCFVGDVWLIGVDGGDARAITQGPGLDCCAAWRSLPP